MALTGDMPRPQLTAPALDPIDLVEQHYAAVYNLAYRTLGRREDAEDVAQLTFARALARLGDLRQPAAARGWLLRIAANCCLDELRQRRRFASMSPCADPLDGVDASSWTALPDASPAAAPAQAAELHDLRVAVWQATLKLPSQQRLALALRELHGMSYLEIADALRTTVGAVETLLFRARQGFRRAYQPDGPGQPQGACGSIMQRLSASIDGELAPGEQARIDAHLPRCAACRFAARELRAMSRLYGLIPILMPALPLDAAAWLGLAGSTAVAAGFSSAISGSAAVAGGAAAGIGGAAAVGVGSGASLAGLAAGVGGAAASLVAAKVALATVAAALLVTVVAAGPSLVPADVARAAEPSAAATGTGEAASAMAAGSASGATASAAQSAVAENSGGAGTATVTARAAEPEAAGGVTEPPAVAAGAAQADAQIVAPGGGAAPRHDEGQATVVRVADAAERVRGGVALDASAATDTLPKVEPPRPAGRPGVRQRPAPAVAAPPREHPANEPPVHTKDAEPGQPDHVKDAEPGPPDEHAKDAEPAQHQPPAPRAAASDKPEKQPGANSEPRCGQVRESAEWCGEQA